MRATQDSAMQDTCHVLVFSSSGDDWGNPDSTYTPGDALECGVEHVAPSELQESGNVPEIDARIRMPIDTVLDPKDRIRVTYRYGEALGTSQDFEIVGPVTLGPSGLVVECALVVR